MKDSAFQKHLWLIETISQAGEEGITYEEINRKWEENPQSKGKYYPLRTFHNHRKEIREVFFIHIRCRKSTNCYYISTSGKGSNAQQKLLELISIQQFVHKHPAIAQRIFIETRAAGEFSLPRLMDAIQAQHYVQIEYCPYWSDKKLTYNRFAVYAVKEFKRKWYLLGQREGIAMEFIDLRQVTAITFLKETFTAPTETEITAALEENYGSKIEEIPTEEITIRVDAPISGFWRANPIHGSQQEIEKRKNYSIFYFYVKPTREFLQEILSYGASIEILSPTTFRTAVAKEAKKLERKNC